MLKKILSKIKRRWLPYMIAYSAKLGVRLLLWTCKIEIHGLDHFSNIARQMPCILMLWHNRLIIISEVLNTFAPQFGYAAFISKSRDGDPLALLAKSYKSGSVLRVPHNARHRALGRMIDHLKERREVILITPDGPRGPRYVVKPGIVLATRESAAKIIPFSWEADRTWHLNTWDKMRIPKPFSRIKVTFGTAISLEKSENSDLKKDTALLETSLRAIGND